MGGCVRSEVRARTSQPIAEMLKGTSLLRKKKKTTLGENEGQVQVSQLAKPGSCPLLCGTPIAMVHFWALPGGLRSPRLLALLALPEGAPLLRDMPAFPSHLPGPQGLLLPTAHRLLLTWSSCPHSPRLGCPSSGLRPSSSATLFLGHSRRPKQVRAPFPASSFLPEAPPDPGQISSDPSVL